MAKQTKLCGKPHSLSDSWRCVVSVDERGRHEATHLGWCLCSCESKNEVAYIFILKNRVMLMK